MVLAVNSSPVLSVFIDLQAGFTSQNGTLARAKGNSEVEPVVEAVAQCITFLDHCPKEAEIVLVRAEYIVGQFCNGDAGALLSNLCVPRTGDDCEWAAPELSYLAESNQNCTVITKHTHSACTESDYCDLICRFAREGGKTIVFGGILTEYCVLETVLDTKKLLISEGFQVFSPPDESFSWNGTQGDTTINIIVIEEMVGSRAAKWEAKRDALQYMRAEGINIVGRVEDLLEEPRTDY